MKPILAALILFSGVSFAPADEPVKSLVQFNEADVVNQALKYLKAAKPEVDAQKVEIHSIQYTYCREPADTTLSVTFKLVGSQTKIEEGGHSYTLCQSLKVDFPHASAPAGSVTFGTITDSKNLGK